MTVNVKRPLIIGGGLLALSLGALDLLHLFVGEWGMYAAFALMGAAGVQWLHKQADRKKVTPQAPLKVDSVTVKRTLAEATQVMTQLQEEVEDPAEKVACTAAQPRVSRLQSQISQLRHELNREELRIAVMGAKGTGKTALLQLLQSAWVDHPSRVLHFSEVPSFTATTAPGLIGDTLGLQQAITADLVLFVVTGDMTASELQAVKRVVATKRTVLVFNKLDQYLPSDRDTILSQLYSHLESVLAAADVVAIATAPKPIKVRQHQTDGSITEWLEEQAPDWADLTQRLEQILAQEGQQLVMASALNRAVTLKHQAKLVLNDVRRTRALPVVEQFQWVAAGTAFVCPVPTLDVLATAAVNAQMILDLGTLYRQKFSLQQAQKMAATIGSLMLKLGLVELSTQTIAGFLKVNVLTYVAGGCIQGVSAAYLTRIVGLSLIEYFHAQEPNLTLTEASPLAIERLSDILQSVFQKNQQLTFLQSFVGQAMERLVASTNQPSQSPSQFPSQAIDTVPSEISPAVLAEPLLIPLKTASALSDRQEVRILDENGASVRRSMPSLDPTSLSSH
ncbi:slr1306 family protein [Stenomitos frigidus]|uniref:DUF697 domain-containing protein n=1 Tax=Stenomitos frigidus ULC18 TaxID=2107698 RepID=A0A2T1DUF6_9CYAN|nr:DUF697 domain-containing protein [Stenomitos frigidus]PSB24138.1 hypothetical protein C7B82_28365 [Stenomitos frigidus ULC18]